uniref:Putative secreted protein n=1 Tax=Xenopsylla cheopis TaxID=163159 RepID=A0A6M2DZY8_XENCH
MMKLMIAVQNAILFVRRNDAAACLSNLRLITPRMNMPNLFTILAAAKVTRTHVHLLLSVEAVVCCNSNHWSDSYYNKVVILFSIAELI